MFDPIGSEYHDEFIEIYNTSDSDSVDLAGWQVSDGLGLDTLIEFGEGLILAPRQFGIILDGSYSDNSTYYDSLIPDGALKLQIDNNSLGSGGLSNSTAETIYLMNETGDTISIYTYSLDNTPGHSDEKIILEAENSQENWANSLVLNGTPGFKNSVSPKEFDLEVNRIFFLPTEPGPGENVEFIAIIKNCGMRDATEFGVELFEDLDRDSVLEFSERLSTETISLLTSGDSTTVSAVVEGITPGRHEFWARVNLVDDDTTNNLLGTALIVGYPEKAVIINEIMYSPLPDGAEWVEFFVLAEDGIDIQAWGFSDADTSRRVVLSDSSYPFEYQQYFVVAADSTILDRFGELSCPLFIPHNFPILNNTDDQIYLFDEIGNMIDVVSYQRNWGGGTGVSLERINSGSDSNDSLNWSSSVDSSGGTPGRKNTVSPKDFDIAVANIWFTPAHPSPGQGVEIGVIVKNVGTQGIANFDVDFYEDVNYDSALVPGEKLSTHLIQFLANGDSIAVFESLNEITSGRHEFWVRISFTDEDTTNNLLSAVLNVQFEERTVVINEIMYQPLSGQTEWIECYVRDEGEISIQDWQVSDDDSSDRIPITQMPFYLDPGAYFVIARDSSIRDFFGLLNCPLFVLQNFPGLNNDADCVYLFDGSDRVIDSVPYLSGWGGDYGISLERINPHLGSNDPDNWASSVYTSGGTPGRKNSIFVEILPSGVSLGVSPNPFSPDGDGYEDVTILSYHLPVATAGVSIEIYDVRGRLVRTLQNNQPSGSEGRVIWDGQDDNGGELRMGIYIIFLEALNAQKGVVKSVKKPVVLARRL
ncbi:lamin tail domain-containing protein [candidate division KSB1 bacterium]|nr:lamin tail domain-containing protein [candidate division KSB1 bacterium]